MLAVTRTDLAPTSIHDRVHRSLRGRIMRGELAPGLALTVRGIAAEYSVSMTPAREAIRRLSAEGALSVSPSGRVTIPEIGRDRIEELSTLRSLIEVELASRALPRAHLALIERLQTINAQIAEAIARQDVVGYIGRNLDFHRTLYLRAQSPAMLAMAESVWLQMGPAVRAGYERSSGIGPPEYHRPIISALRDGDEPGLRLAVRTDVSQSPLKLFGEA